MISIKANINLKIGKVTKDIEKAVRDGLQKSGFLIERKAKVFAPHDTGQLTASIRAVPVEKTVFGWRVSVGVGVRHGVLMERPGGLGVKSRAKGSRRPYLKPALAESSSKVVQILRDEIRRVA